LLIEQGIDAALAVDPGLAGEDLGDYFNAEMGFALGTGAGMAGMEMRLVDHR